MTVTKQRLYFIDIARSIAILLMLEGHFIDDTLVSVARDPTNVYYTFWLFIRGYTSPIFLTITGVVFTYLLLGDNEVTFSKNMRVRKGLKRGLELIFWGYLLEYYSFHVLQCIIRLIQTHQNNTLMDLLFYCGRINFFYLCLLQKIRRNRKFLA